jgi:hypothetical protein
LLADSKNDREVVPEVTTRTDGKERRGSNGENDPA